MAHLAVFGAGPALGLSAARRFGRAGYSVTLIARNPDRLEQMRAVLAADGVEADVQVADLADDPQVDVALKDLRAHHGIPDVVLYSPSGLDRLPVDALALDADTLRAWLPTNLTTPVRIMHALLPGMIERGSGAILVAQGSSVLHPRTMLASVSVPQSGLLNYLYSVDQQVRPRGVRVGSLLIGRLIETSAAEQVFDTGHFDSVDAGEFERVHPDALAQDLFEMATTDAEVAREA
ncbi:NAD(P)-dependent dehydrogenase (short-subunit alcohol dehydrogenase family) [Nocardia sp. GAS34]|uniref:SDR family NAD(P)-dependent oxidoreductase n=1 Tax=unclassified Nocardia TaxID=2637762 RepID=UPI003D205545